jgi:hypothetical protein
MKNEVILIQCDALGVVGVHVLRITYIMLNGVL